MLKVYFSLFVSLFLVFETFSQKNQVHQDVIEAKNQNQITEVIDIDIKHNLSLKTNEKSLANEIPIDFNLLSLNKIISNQSDYIHFSIPNLKGDEIELDLIKASIFGDDFKVTIDASDYKYDMSFDKNDVAFYRGIVRGDENSLVAISFFKGHIRGFINSSHAGNIGIRQNDEGIHVLQNLEGLYHQELSCGTKDDGVGYSSDMLRAPKAGKAAGDYVGIFVEVENDMTDQLGGVNPTITYMTDLFNETAAIYAGDGVEIRISELEINTTPEYGTTRGKNFRKPNGSSQYLSLFQDAQSSSFQGDLAQLVVYNNVGGVAAGFSGLCNSDRRESMCISGFVNDYWFNVQIFAHELGHLFGSRHTHACVWNGNNTAIDGCSGSTEGTCSLPPPAGQDQGTIMSYCYNNYGLDFNEGFHPQPAAVLQNNVVAASCLMSGGGTNCFDGIQNGDETGVDCGGSCVACPTCSDGVQNGDETGIDCGGSCPNTCPPVSCDDPTNLAVNNMRKQQGTESATLDWSDVSGALSYDARIREAGTSAWSTFNSTTSDIRLQGFTKNTDYEWEVRANCTSGSSLYVGCAFTYVSRGSNVDCGIVAPSAGYTPSGSLSEEIRLSPNPASSFVLLEINHAKSDLYKVNIFNSIGQMIHTHQVVKEQPWVEIDVNTYQTGLYFASIDAVNSKTVIKFIVE